MNTRTGVAHRATATEDGLGRFAVKGVFWRKYLDWAVVNLPFFFYPVNVFFFTLFFFFFAAPARRAIMANLAVVLPGSSRTMNYLRAFRTLLNFAWTISEAAIYRILHEEFSYEIVGAEWLEEVGAAPGAIVLTAHMGRYDLGAALCAEKFHREIRIVRAQASKKPLFSARMGCRRYEIIVRKPSGVQSTGNREADVGKGVAEWCLMLEEVIGGHWDQWFAFVPIFDR